MRSAITSLFILTVLLSGAQTISVPTIPNTGTSLDFDLINDTVPVSISGPWDFSSIQSAMPYTMRVLPKDSSIHVADYPNATHVLKSDNGEFFLGFDSGGLTSHGKVTSSTISSYATPLTLIPYPSDASTVHTDSISSPVTWNGISTNITDKAEVEGVAFGAVTMPDGITYQDAVVLSTKRTSVTGPSPFGTYLTLVEYSKVFWLPGYPIPVIEVLHVESNGSSVFTRSLFLKGASTAGSFENENISLDVYPNPFFNTLNLTLEDKSDLRVYDATGAIVWEKADAPPGAISIDFSSHPTGTYTIEISKNASFLRRKIIKQ
jgi:hypothetical protein